MQFRSSLRTTAVSALLAAACVVAATPAFADPGYTQDNRVSLLLRNESGCTASAEFFRAGKREIFATIGNGHMWQAYNEGQYRMAGTAKCGTDTANIEPRDVTLSKSRAQTIVLRRAADGKVFYQ